ncbi:hypothetical protein Vse01_30720 [Micromonospora sediminimaris]|uniref:Uncharacterized protein n=1 Tax=Micromonospora sediminimaris TaxID=547162 RepID=A0A9W5USV0_9ACTN|nr:hypothetical protein Vse01_30720 [Micromonospora sediminimaris]
MSSPAVPALAENPLTSLHVDSLPVADLLAWHAAVGYGGKPDRRAPHPLRSLTTTVATTTGGEDALTD